jgi:hypothetical protein
VRATCTACGQRMDIGAGCTLEAYDDIAGPGQDPLQRQPYEGPGEHCHDCNVTQGQLHHPGCDMERCPACGGQAIGCGCADE